MLLIACAGIVLLTIPAFRFPFDPDEHLLLGAVDGTTQWMGTPGDVYHFSSGEPADVAGRVRAGAFPWFTAPDWKYALWRPLASANWALDHAIFGNARAGYQLHNLISYLLLIASVAWCLRQSLAPRAAGLALMIFTFHPTHAEPLVWLSARHTIDAMIPAVLGLGCYIRWIGGGWRPGMWLSAALFIMSMFASEAGIQTIAFAFSFTLFGIHPGGARARGGLLLLLLCVGGYTAIHRATGHGVRDCTGYTDPIEHPLDFMINGFIQIRECCARAIPGLASLGLGAVGATVLLILMAIALDGLPGESLKRAAWWPAGAALSAMAGGGGVPEDRMFMSPSLGFAAFAASAAAAGWTLYQKQSAALTQTRKIALLCGGVLVMIQICASPVAFGTAIFNIGANVRRQNAVVCSAGVPPAAKEVFVINCPEWLLAAVGGDVRARAGEQEYVPWRTLALSRGTFRFTRAAADGFELQLLDGRPMDVSRFRNINDHPLRVGDEIQCGAFRITIEEAAGGAPVRIAFSHRLRLDDPALCFLRVENKVLDRFAMPSVGESVLIYNE